MQSSLLQEKQEKSPLSAPPPKHRPWWQQAGQFFLFAFIGIAALESYFNLAGVGNEEFLEPDPTLGVRHIPGKKVVWRLEGFSNDYLSKQGLRDTEHSLAKPQGTFRIALLGDSATEGMQVPLTDTYGKQLENLLNESRSSNKQVEVINFGCSSYSNGQETLQLESQVAAFKPDMVVMMYNRGDYLENIRDPSTLKAEPRPYFHMDEHDVLVQDNTIMQVNKRIFKYDPLLDFLRRNSRIYGVLSHTNLALSLNEVLYSKIRNFLIGFIPGAKDSWKHVEAAYIIQDPWKVTSSIISRANADCQQMNSKFMLVCFPNIVNDREYANQIQLLKKQSESQNFLYLDLTPNYLNNPKAKDFFLKYHFSSEGHFVAARQIFEAMRNHKGIP